MSHIMIKRLSFGAAALAGVAALGACGTTGNAGPAPAQTPASSNGRYDTGAKTAASTPVSTSAGAPVSASAGAGNDKGGGVQRCATDKLKLEVGPPVENPDSPGQYDLQLTFRNISGTTCALYGVPGVDLVGPNDPNGPVYHLTRIDNGPKYNEVPAGSAASASITFLRDGDGAIGSNGSTDWTPNTIVTTPPGQTTQLSAAWPAGYNVLRQDEATHPGTYVNGVLGTH